MIELRDVTVEQLEIDPYPIYAELRERSPVAYMPCLDTWMVTSWATVEAACIDPAAFPAQVERSPTDRALGGISMMTTDGDPAKRRRRPFDATLRPRSVEATMPAAFERLCRERLHEIATAGAGDLVATAIAENSRNRRAGEMVGAGVPAGQVQASMDQTAESLATVPLLGLAFERQGIDAPVTTGLRRVLDGFHLAPRGMGALATPTTDADVDELAAAVLRRLGAMTGVPAV